ncbi:hypothetical protein [Bacteroides sp.]
MKTKTVLYRMVLLTVFLCPMHLHAQGWMSIGSTLNQKVSQDANAFTTHFNPDIELGLRLPFAVFSGNADLSDYSDSDICWGLGASFNFRFIDIDKIDWTKKDNYKFVWDAYLGPSFYFPFSSESVTGLLVNPFLGYSTSSAWFDPDITSGSFSVKLSADLVIHHFSIGAAWHPLKQHIEGKSAKTEYLTFRSFDLSPSFEIRIGYFGIF